MKPTLALTTALALASLGVSAFAQSTPADPASPPTKQTEKKQKKHRSKKSSEEKKQETNAHSQKGR